jgi:DeoR family fructose operon transcriptional repressor
VERLTFERNLPAREISMTSEKERIAKAAYAELPEQGTVLLDAGTTTAALAELFPADAQLTVVTNSLPIASRLATHRGITTLLLGGRVRGTTLSAVDAWALRVLDEIHVDVSFMATNGFSVELGCTTPDIGEAAVKRAMVAAAERVVLLADSSKYGSSWFARFADLHDVEIIVTDTGLDERQVPSLEAAGPRVVRA